jgi:hypothetical protein
MVVCGPWPGSTTTESGSGSTFVRKLLSMSGWFPPGKSVLPIEPANSTSPEKTSESMSGSGSYVVWNITEPGVWPGACSAPNCSPATVTSEPSRNSRTSSGSLKLAGPPDSRSIICRVSSLIARNGSVSSTRSSVCTQQVASLDRHSGVTENMWSRCPWVSNTATGLSRCSATRSVTPSTASIPGSMITHSAPGSVATR